MIIKASTIKSFTTITTVLGIIAYLILIILGFTNEMYAAALSSLIIGPIALIVWNFGWSIIYTIMLHLELLTAASPEPSKQQSVAPVPNNVGGTWTCPECGKVNKLTQRTCSDCGHDK